MGYCGAGTLVCYCTGLSSRKFPRVGDSAAPRVPAGSSLEPSFSWRQGTFLLSDVCWQCDQVVVFDLYSLWTWPIKPYPTELLSRSLGLTWLKGSLGPQNEEKAQKQRESLKLSFFKLPQPYPGPKSTNVQFTTCIYLMSLETPAQLRGIVISGQYRSSLSSYLPPLPPKYTHPSYLLRLQGWPMPEASCLTLTVTSARQRKT